MILHEISEYIIYLFFGFKILFEAIFAHVTRYLLGKKKNIDIVNEIIAKTPSKEGYTAVVTGSNSGIGLETAYHLALVGYHVIIACRNEELGREAIKYIVKECKSVGKKASVDYIRLDLSSFDSIRQFASNIKKQKLKVNLLVNNAGVMFTPNYKTKEGHEIHFGVNYLGHFCLTFELLPVLIKNKPSRILNLTSDTYTMGVVNKATIRGENFHRWWSYCNSKLAIVIHTLTFQKKLKELGIDDIHVFAVNPGVVSTNITRTSLRILKYLYDLQVVRKLFGFQTPREGSSSSVYASLSEEVLRHKDKLIDFTCETIEINDKAKDPDVGNELWNSSQDFVGKTLESIIENECN